PCVRGRGLRGPSPHPPLLCRGSRHPRRGYHADRRGARAARLIPGRRKQKRRRLITLAFFERQREAGRATSASCPCRNWRTPPRLATRQLPPRPPPPPRLGPTRGRFGPLSRFPHLAHGLAPCPQRAQEQQRSHACKCLLHAHHLLVNVCGSGAHYLRSERLPAASQRAAAASTPLPAPPAPRRHA